MIRKYQPQDLEHIMKIWLETNLAAHGFIPAEYWNEQYEAVKEALPQADILIYEEEGTVLGFLGLQDSYIAGLFVEKASRSRGIGRLLLEAAVAPPHKKFFGNIILPLSLLLIHHNDTRLQLNLHHCKTYSLLSQVSEHTV